MKETLKAVRAARKALAQMANDLPDLDANCMVYSILMYAVEELNICIKELPSAIKEAKQLAKEYPNLKGKVR
jgi:hypothetical protein